MNFLNLVNHMTCELAFFLHSLFAKQIQFHYKCCQSTKMSKMTVCTYYKVVKENNNSAKCTLCSIQLSRGGLDKRTWHSGLKSILIWMMSLSYSNSNIKTGNSLLEITWSSPPHFMHWTALVSSQLLKKQLFKLRKSSNNHKSWITIFDKSTQNGQCPY